MERPTAAHRIVRGTSRLVRLALAAGLAAALLAGCATPHTRGPRVSGQDKDREAAIQRRLYVKEILSMNTRLHNVGYTVARAGEPLCPAKAPGFGMVVESTPSFPEDLREAFDEVMKPGDRPVVVGLLPGGPADRAGVRVGDRIVSVDKESAGEDDADLQEALFTAATQALRERRRTLRFQLQRGALPVTAEIEPEVVCGYFFRLELGEAPNAYSTGPSITVSQGMMRLADTDEYLAVVLGHEMAHSAYGHLEAQKENSAVGGILDVLSALAGGQTHGAFSAAAGNAFSTDFEREADYAGLYFTARAGYPVDHAADFWRRMSLRNMGTISRDTDHPSNAERYELVERTAAEIDAKIAAGEPLVPNMDEKTGDAAGSGRAEGAAAPDRGVVRGSE
ncbi:peptidase M48 Ste24p [Desulfovibrio sp. X2]|uniref:M48 family metallopeptidase n=1 Tax=Desulfovibrio sp. X2 TaxID=941449 RepID=UPI000358CBB1|nr:M48 family metallopeptidase [Desulfovibrio sp. X2]EPR41816.1 peptidase M48 Ste24p [Desulfovibrio sp. X2]